MKHFAIAACIAILGMVLAAIPSVLCEDDGLAPLCAPSITGYAVKDGQPATLTVSMHPLSKDLNYIFMCNATGFAPADYIFDYDDGTSERKVESNNYPYKWDGAGQQNVTGVQATHYFAPGRTYNVTCPATDGELTVVSSIIVMPRLPEQATEARIGAYLTTEQVGPATYNITMHPVGFKADYLAYWEITDGEQYVTGTATGESLLVAVPHPGDWKVSVSAASFNHAYEPSHYELCDGSCENIVTSCGRSHLGCESPTAQTTLFVSQS